MNTANTAPDMSMPHEGALVANVPRINIGVFCDNQQTGQTVQAASIDRRMSKAHTSIQLGGIASAVQVYQAEATPNVVVVESHGDRNQIMAELASFAAVCQPTTKVIVIGHVNDVILYRELIKNGVSEYLVAPITALQFIEASNTTAAFSGPLSLEASEMPLDLGDRAFMRSHAASCG